MGPCKSKSGISDATKKPKYEFYRGYKSGADLFDYDKFFEPETKSECKKCLTKEIWEEYKDQSCA